MGHPPQMPLPKRSVRRSGLMAALIVVAVTAAGAPPAAAGDHHAKIEGDEHPLPAPTANVGLLDESSLEGSILEESRRLNASLMQFDIQLRVMADRARFLGDGHMLACIRELGVANEGLQHAGQHAYVELLASVTEEDTAKRLHAIQKTEIIRARAQALDLAEDQCLGITNGTYVLPSADQPDWGPGVEGRDHPPSNASPDATALLLGRTSGP